MPDDSELEAIENAVARGMRRALREDREELAAAEAAEAEARRKAAPVQRRKNPLVELLGGAK